MVTVTECTTLGKGRLRFHLDNGTELVLYRGEAKQFRMREGSTLSDEEEHQLIYEVVGKRAKRRTMHLLEQMDRTEQQLREKLKQGGYPQACIDLALEYVKSFHYVDDASGLLFCISNLGICYLLVIFSRDKPYSNRSNYKCDNNSNNYLWHRSTSFIKFSLYI